MSAPPPPLSVYLAIRANDQVRRFISIHLHYITFTFDSPVRQGIFLPESASSADSLTCVRTAPCAIACINICTHVKDLVVHARVRWITETLKQPACTVG